MQTENKLIDIKVVDDLSPEPVSLSDVKSFASITFSDKDSVIQSLAITARKQLESVCGLSFGQKKLQLIVYMMGDITVGFRLPGGPVDTIDVVQWRITRLSTYTDITTQTTEWEVESDSLYSIREGFFKIDYTTEDWDIPEDILTAIKAQAQYLYEAIGDETKSGSICEIAQCMIEPYINGDLIL